MWAFSVVLISCCALVRCPWNYDQQRRGCTILSPWGWVGLESSSKRRRLWTVCCRSHCLAACSGPRLIRSSEQDRGEPVSQEIPVPASVGFINIPSIYWRYKKYIGPYANIIHSVIGPCTCLQCTSLKTGERVFLQTAVFFLTVLPVLEDSK